MSVPVFPPNFTVSDFLAIERHADEHLSVDVLENKPPRRFAPCLLDAGDIWDRGHCVYCIACAASETQQLSYVPMVDTTPVCYLSGIAMGQPSTSDGPTCNTPSSTTLKF